MPVYQGEKYACSSCIKGHRVSGCTHHDRELHPIRPKGRPVKQCEHCRGARKSKSHHAKCDCGDKKHKDKGDAKVHDNHCGCHSGAKCVCGVKKESLDLKLDTSKMTLHAARAKPKLSSTQSESTLTVFANGHHKPCHRNNITAHVSGVPYKLGRPHTLHGMPVFSSVTHNRSQVPSDAQAPRSMDTLSMSNSDFYTSFGLAQRSMESLPISSLAGAVDSSSIDPLFTGQSATFSHCTNSPNEPHLDEAITGQQWPWPNAITPINRNFGYGSLSTSPSQACLPNFGYGSLSTSPSQDCLPNIGYGSLSTSPSQDCLLNVENEWTMSAGSNNPLFTAGDLPLDPNKLNDTLAQPISHSGESNQQSTTGLTASSSAHSEVGEPILFPSTVSDSLFWEDNPVFRFTPNAQSGVVPAPTSTAAPGYLDVASFPKPVNALPTTMAGQNPSDKNSLFTSTDFHDACANTMPNDVNTGLANDNWTPSDETLFLDVNLHAIHDWLS